MANPKPFAESCEQNKMPILAVLQVLLADRQQVLEIGSGTGQHAVWFAQHLPHLIWQTSEVSINLEGINAWLLDAQLPNTPAPLRLDVTQESWPTQPVDAVFSANTAHIMSWEAVQCCFSGVGKILKETGLFMLYGPFSYHGKHTSPSNAQFDHWLKARDPRSGVRDFHDLDQLAQAQQLVLQDDIAMPVNNRILVWRKQSSA